MIFIENLLSARDVANFLRPLFPGHGQQPIEIIAGDSRLSRHRRHGFELLQLLHGLITHVFGHARSFYLFLQLIEFALFAASEFLLNGFDLFVEVILFLGPLHLPLDPRLDGAIHVQLFNLDIENIANPAQALGRIEDFEQFLLFLD